MMKKMLVFDMDGTIADFYGVQGWLEDLQNESTRPYETAKPLYDMDALCEILEIFKSLGWVIVVTTWLAKNSTKSYDDKVRKAKLDWLAKYNFPYDEIHLVQHGTTKANCTRNKADYQILIDDNEQVRKGWTLGGTINANKNIMKKLVDLLLTE